MSDTPRTDKVAETVANVYGGGTVVPVEFARQLERELALANARIDYLMSPDSSSPEERQSQEKIAAALIMASSNIPSEFALMVNREFWNLLNGSEPQIGESK